MYFVKRRNVSLCNNNVKKNKGLSMFPTRDDDIIHLHAIHDSLLYKALK